MNKPHAHTYTAPKSSESQAH